MSAAVMPMEDFRNKPDREVMPSMSMARKDLNMNWYATKKTIAQGMLDIALLTANAAQLKHILLTKGNHQFYYPMLTFICLSIALQILVGIGQLILVGININHVNHQRMADILNNIVTSCVFSITVINVIISAFGIEGDTSGNVMSSSLPPH